MYKNQSGLTPERMKQRCYTYTLLYKIYIQSTCLLQNQFVRMKSCDLLVVFQLALDLHNLLRQSASPPVVLPADHKFSKFHKPCEKFGCTTRLVWEDPREHHNVTVSFYGKCYDHHNRKEFEIEKFLRGMDPVVQSVPVESETLVRHSRWRWKYTLSPQRASHWSCAWSPLASGLNHWQFGADLAAVNHHEVSESCEALRRQRINEMSFKYI